MKYKTKYLNSLKKKLSSLETEISRLRKRMKKLEHTKEKVREEIIIEGGKVRKREVK